jgi:MSHA pilin protein MshA
MKKLQKQAGFTLIELVVVIVILGILAATAAPKFIDLTDDAKQSVMKGVQGAVNSAADMAHAKALVDSQTGPTGAISVAGNTIDLVHGWPNVTSLTNLLDIDFSEKGDISVTGGTFFHQDTDSTNISTCQVVYENAENNFTKPDITPTITNCN